MRRARLPHPWPRRLRWRLVLGFALTVALLQAALTGAQRVLLEQTLVGEVTRNLEATASMGLASQMPKVTADANAVAKLLAVSFPPDKAAVQPLKRSVALLSLAAYTQGRLADLGHALVLPDQPAAILNTRGDVLWQQAVLAQDRQRRHALAPAVMAGLLGAAVPRASAVTTPWSTQVATPDGPYLLLIWPTAVPVLSQQQADQVFRAWKVGGPEALADPNRQATLAKIHPTRLVLLVAQRLGGTEQTVQTVMAISLGGALLVIVLAALLGLLVVGRALRPLAAITGGAERLARGEYHYRVPLDQTADEVGRLASAFNHMAAAIAAAFATQRRFVADASHELRTPLTALRGYSDVLLLGAGEDPATAQRVLRAMQEDLGRMSRLVDDLLTLARLDGGVAPRLEPIALADLLSAAAEEGRALSSGRHQITGTPVSPELAVWGDRDRLRQVLSNVVGNACAYCPPGRAITLCAMPAGGWAIVEVRDDGPGIPAANLARLGERFYRGDAARSRRTGGTGLGLAIARAIVEAHGGTLTIESAVGAGTTVTIRVPLSSRAVVAPPPEPRAPVPLA